MPSDESTLVTALRSSYYQDRASLHNHYTRSKKTGFLIMISGSTPNARTFTDSTCAATECILGRCRA
ncbi:hypothetical protein EGR_09879 [Echinococcus granulosus]|uniref:Uncharacterized protein n=1 Tax=Echinococcus granulosus TaxID=6210 RepID=W6U2I3_ECHGR|nr:hypothetical protein EGR_09879 [Echinococcus granulosus]EUB55278.1 hypothetical protein EGR_09879 [Echinococcus granulosus]